MKSSLLCLCALLVCVAGQRITTIQLDGVQYFVSRMNPYSPELNYFLAYQYCRSLGLQLASFETKEKVESMTQYLQNAGYSKYDFWTSGNRLGTGMFLWMSTGLPFNATFDYFESDHNSVQNLDPNSNTSPQRTARDSNSGLDKGCVILKAPSLKWAPEDCSSIKDFICEQTRCYYYNYGSIPVSSAQGRPITTSTPYPTITTTALPYYMSTLAATANEKQQAPLLISRSANLGKDVVPTVAATPAVEVKAVPVTEETAATATHEYEEDVAGDEGEEDHTEGNNSIDEEEADTTQQSQEEEVESDAMTHDQKIVASVDGTSVEIPVEQKLKQISAEIEKYSATDKDNETGRQSFMTLSDLLKNLRPNDKITPQIDSDYSNTMRVLGETSILHGRKMKNPEINRSLTK